MITISIIYCILILYLIHLAISKALLTMASGYYHKKHYYKNRKYQQPDNYTPQPERQARAYQTELLESALKGNRIIALGTGAGKTHIACMLINQMKIDGSLSDDKKIMFLAPTDALVRQQNNVICQSTRLRVRDYIGGSGISDWGLENWEEELTNVDVLVMIAQSALNALNNGVLLVSRIGLLIFDECHHARRNHPYREIMRTLDDNVKRLDCDSPKILGLSASIVTRNLKDFDQVEKEISELEEILHSKAVTTTDAKSMSIHVTNPTEQSVYYEPYPMRRCDYMGEMKVFLNFFLQRDNVMYAGWEFPVRNTVEVCKTAIADCIYALNELGTKPCIKCTNLYINHLDKYCMNFSKNTRRIFTKLDASFVSNTRTVLKRLLRDLLRVYTEETCLSPKVYMLSQVIREFKFSEKAKIHDNTIIPPLLSGIVFVNRRITAVLLKDIFEGFRFKQSIGYSDIYCGSVVGHGSTSVVPEAEMNIFDQEKVLQGFRYKELNILFATNVLEEGLDVPQCNLIIRFDLPLTPRSYIQSKGRARNKEAMLYHMIQKDELVEQTKNLDTFKRIESILTSTCMSRGDTVHERVEELGDIPPYIIQSTGAKITGASAIQLVNCYCQRLCRDHYYIPKPSFVTRKIEQPTNIGFVCNLILPEKAPIRDIMKSEVCTTLENAKREAHMNTCIKLYGLGEIDEYLQITYKDKNEGITMDDLTTKLSEVNILGKNCYYEKKIPSVLSKPINIKDDNTTNFIYKFTVVITESGEPYWGQEDNEKYYENPNNYIGIITAESIPFNELPSFEVFYHGLNIKTKLTPIRTKTPLKNVFSRLLKFQESVFCEVLNYHKYGFNFKFAPDQANDRNFLICPLRQIQMEEWDFDINTLNNFAPDAVLRSDNDEFYVHRVVSKSNSPSDYFHIIQMITADKLDTPFPDTKYSSYGDYLSSKCGISVSRQDYSRPVLEGLHTSSHVNLITSRHKTQQGIDLPKPDYDKKEKTYFFSPSLLVHPIPSTVWRLCVILPSILYRLESFILMLEFSNSVEGCVTRGTGEPPVIENGVMRETHDTPAHLNYQTVPELCVNECGERPDLISLLTAFTAASAADFINSERQEFIGDSLLKLIASLYLFTHTTLRNEGDLTELRTKYISNETLCKLALKKGIVHLMRVDSFLLRKNYSPPGFEFANTSLNDAITSLSVEKEKITFKDDLLILTEHLNNITKSNPRVASSLPFRFQQINNKTTADCIEAVLSSYVCCGGLQQGLKFISYLDFGIDSTLQTMDLTYSRHHDEMGHFFNPPNAFSHFANEYDYTELHLSFTSEDVSDLPPSFISNIRRFHSTVLHYEFKNISLLIEAFTHPSFMQRITPTDKARPSYQRLEFLGDALLDYFTCVYVYQKYKSFQPEQLSMIKAAVVSNSRLSMLSLGGEWYKCLLSNDRLKFCIENADNEFREQYRSRDFNVSDDTEIPYHKPLADIVEAVIAAVFVDSRFSLDTTWDVFRPIFKPLIDDIAKKIPKNPVNHLYELRPKSKITVDVQSIVKGLFQCRIQVDGEDCTEIGSSYVLAKNKCAQKVVESLSKKSENKRT